MVFPEDEDVQHFGSEEMRQEMKRESVGTEVDLQTGEETKGIDVKPEAKSRLITKAESLSRVFKDIANQIGKKEFEGDEFLEMREFLDETRQKANKKLGDLV